jgi:hypothetical protein
VFVYIELLVVYLPGKEEIYSVSMMNVARLICFSKVVTSQLSLCMRDGLITRCARS